MWKLTSYTASPLHTSTCIEENYSRKRKTNCDQYSLSWVPVCTRFPCGQHLDQTRWQDGNSRCRSGNKQFVIQNQWGRVFPFLSQDRPSRSWLRSKTPTRCTSYWKPPAVNKRQRLKCPSANRLHAFANLIHRSVTSDSCDNSVRSALRFEPRDGSDSRQWISLATTTHPERCLSSFYTIPNVKPGILPHWKW